MAIVLLPARGWSQESPTPVLPPALDATQTVQQPSPTTDPDLPPLPEAPDPGTDPDLPPLPEAPDPDSAPSDSPETPTLGAEAAADEPAPVFGPAGSPGIPEETNLGVPFGLLPSGGGQPTDIAEPETPAIEGPGWIDRALGLTGSPVHVHGWIQNTFTGNTNGTPSNRVNEGLYPNHLANQWMGNQYYLVLERLMETGDDFDWGYRFDTLFGYDWQFTLAFGLLDTAFPPLAFQGLDFPQFYAEAHLPILTEGGLDIKFGRWYSIGGYESVMAVRRPLLSWSYLTTYFPFTYTGPITTFHLTDQINIFNGAAPGVDRWFNARYKWSYVGGIGWTSRDGRTSATSVVTVGPNQLPFFLTEREATFAVVTPTNITPPPFKAGQPNPGYPRNIRTYTQNVITHNWSDKLTQAFEISLAYEQKTPNAGPLGTSKDTYWYGAANWFLYEFTPKLTGVWRSEIFRVGSPFLTGLTRDTYYEMTLGAIYKPHRWLWFRSELRYDWAQFGDPFNDGTRSSRFTIGVGAILLF